MTASAIHHPASASRRTNGWMFRVLVLSCLGLSACVANWSDTGKSSTVENGHFMPAVAGFPTDAIGFVPGSGSHVELQGSSTIGPWDCNSTTIHGQIILYTDESQLNAIFDSLSAVGPIQSDSNEKPSAAMSVRAPSVAIISVPVMSLHGSSSGMDHDMQQALNADQHPMIEYTMRNLQQASVRQDPHTHKIGLTLSLVGNLSMAGAERPITMDVFVQRDSADHFRVQAQTQMLMSDFGVTPPNALFGLIKGDNHVTVIFDLNLVPVRAAQTALKNAEKQR